MTTPDDDRDDLSALTALSPAANDPFADFTAGPPPVLTLEPEGGEPIPLETFYRDVAADSLEVLAHSGRARFEEPRSRAERSERHANAHVDVLRGAGAGDGKSGPFALAVLEEYLQSAKPRNPWPIWAAALALASFDADGARAALVRGIESRDPEDATSALLAAESIALVRREDDALERALGASAHPVAQAVLLDARVRRGAAAPGALRSALASPHRPLVEVALRALDQPLPRQGSGSPPARPEPLPGSPAAFVDDVSKLLDARHPTTAWRAARFLTLAGDPRPYQAVRDGGPLAARLGALGLELLVMRGRAEDLAAIDARVATMPATAELLSAAGRLGHPRVWSFLAHFLSDDTLGGAAETALVTLLGPCVPVEERRRPGAWKSAVGSLRPDPAVRLRRGEPWRPGVVASEITSGALNRTAIAARLDELTARAGVRAVADLGAWSAVVERALAEISTAASAADRRWAPGTWAAETIR